MKLHSYFRSSAAWRVRAALAWKGLSVDILPVHMLRGGGEQKTTAYAAINPMHLVPALETDDGILTQSSAICEWLEETHPEPPLLPRAPGERAYVRAVAATVACEIHPLNNLRVLGHLTGAMGHSADERTVWYKHWIAEGLEGLEALVAESGRARAFCLGDTVTLAEMFLVPQIYNARRFACDLASYPTLVAIDGRAGVLPAFVASAPDAQPDFEP